MISMLNGAKPAGTPGSTNTFAFVTGLKDPSKTSILPLWKFVARISGADEVPVSAQPLYRAPEAALSTRTLACIASTDGAQPEMMPSWEQKRNDAGLPAATLNTFVLELKLLRITPVTGPPVADPPAAGMLTTVEEGVPVPS